MCIMFVIFIIDIYIRLSVVVSVTWVSSACATGAQHIYEASLTFSVLTCSRWWTGCPARSSAGWRRWSCWEETGCGSLSCEEEKISQQEHKRKQKTCAERWRENTPVIIRLALKLYFHTPEISRFSLKPRNDKNKKSQGWVNVSLKETCLCGASVRVERGRLKMVCTCRLRLKTKKTKTLMCVWGHTHLSSFEDY